MSASPCRPIAVTYPQMERQDLTQGQLGHFKFTPVDEIRAQYQRKTAHLLQEQLAESLKGHYRLQRSSLADSAQHDPPPINSQQQYSQLCRTTLRPQRHYFGYENTSTDKSLTDIGSRIGLTGTRASIDHIPKSPQKSHWPPGIEQPIDSMQPHATPFIPRHVHESSDFNSSLTGFPPSASEIALEDMNNVQSSLIKALAAEQESHQVTKAALKVEKIARAHSENETQRLTDHNRSLINSVNMLKSIIQNQVRKEQEAEAGIPDHKTVEAGLARFKAEIQHEKARNLQQLTGCIINGERQSKQTSEHPYRPQAAAPIKPDCTAPSDQSGAADTDHVFNFDLFPGLQEHTDQIAAQTMRPSTPVSTDRLIDITPDKEIGQQMPLLTVGITSIKDAAELQQNIVKQDSQQAIGLKSIVDNTGRSEPEHQHGQSGIENNMTDTPRANSDLQPEKPLVKSHDALQIKPSNIKSSEPAPKTMTMPYSIRPDWKIGSLNPIFGDEDEKVSRLGYARHPSNVTSPFWEHPVRYLPSKADRNIYRTVMIDFLPNGTTYLDLLRQIRGGALESIQLFQAIGHANSFMTARVVFHYELDAQTTYQHGQKAGIFVHGQRARVWQLLEPTYPKNKQLEEDVFDNGYTRMLMIDSPSQTDISLKLSQKVCAEIRAGSVIGITHDIDGLSIIEFTSVAECAKVMRRLLSDPEFCGTSFDFEQDPCQSPY